MKSEQRLCEKFPFNKQRRGAFHAGGGEVSTVGCHRPRTNDTETGRTGNWVVDFPYRRDAAGGGKCLKVPRVSKAQWYLLHICRRKCPKSINNFYLSVSLLFKYSKMR